MAPKRPSASSTTPTKKAKIASPSQSSPQRSLESFFRQQAGNAAAVKSLHGELQDFQPDLGSATKSLHSLADDEQLAFELSREDGIDVETARKLENSWKKKSSPAFSRAPASTEVIDLDEEDAPTNILPTASSFRAPAKAGPSQSQVPMSPSLVAGLKSPGESTKISIEPTAYSSVYPNLAIDPLEYSLDGKFWPPGSPAPYSFLAYTLSCLSETRSRIAIINILTNALRTLILHHSSSLLPALYLLSNSLSPPYIPIELGLGPSIISKAIQHVSGLTPAALRRLYSTTGDAGDVAFEARSNLRTLIPHRPLLVSGVYESLLKITKVKGEGATKQKQSIVEKLLVAAKGEEIRYLVRTLSQNIRVGAVRTSILTALARAVVLTRPSGQDATLLDSPYFASPLLRQEVQPVTSSKKSSVVDAARTELNEKYGNAEGLVKRVYVQHPNYDHIVAALLEAGLESISACVSLTVGIPLHPTLGSPTRSLDEIYDRLGNLPFTAEFKYDGQRAQIHASKASEGSIIIKIFSRHLEDMTDKYPDIISLVEAIFSTFPETVSFIIDAEIVAIDPSNGSLKTFQELAGRARKDVQLQDVKIAVCVFAFDLMFYNGRVLLEEPFRTRREQLRMRFPTITPAIRGAARLAHVESCESEDGREAVEQFWQRAVSCRSEGLMVKLLDSGEVLEESGNANSKPRKKPLPATYEPDKRTSAWLKLKKDYVVGLGDSLDLVPIGAWHGNGRKAQWWSPILLAVWDESIGQHVGVCKCMSGFSDEFYKALQDRYVEGSESCSRSSFWNSNTGGLRPTVYFKPQEVWEIRGADVTVSPVSSAALGLVSQTRGLSLRFPRFIRIREDKGITDASTPESLATMWRNQDKRGKDRGGVDDGDLVDIVSESSEAEEEDDA